MGYGITSESQIIDQITVGRGCDQIETAAEGFRTAGDKIITAGRKCNQEALSMDDQSLEAFIVNQGEAIKQIYDYVIRFTNSIRTFVSDLAREERAELANYQQQQATSQRNEP